MRSTLARSALVAVLLLGIAGCAPMIGAPSATMISRKMANDTTRYRPVGPRITDEDCFYWTMLFLFFGKGTPSHEAVVGRMLENNKADVLLEAQFTNTILGIPYIYMQTCAEVSGIPAARKN